MKREKVVVLVGPTAVGKTAMAVALAESFQGEVVSLDSRQMVRGLENGTAKPTPEERARVRHHLIDVTTPDRTLSLVEVQRLAYAAIDEVLARSRRPILAGGTGQYVRAVLEGWEIPRVPPDPELRAELERAAAEHGAAALHERLAAVDPAAAGRIDPRNLRRVVRALEVYNATGQPISAIQRRSGPRYPFLTIGLTRPRAELYARIDRRIEVMLDAGLEAEVRTLLAAGYGFDLPALSSLGYGEWRGYFEGRTDREEVVRLIRRHTRRLVRSQATWFRADDPRIRWFDLSREGYPEIREVVARFLDQPTDAHASSASLSQA